MQWITGRVAVMLDSKTFQLLSSRCMLRSDRMPGICVSPGAFGGVLPAAVPHVCSLAWPAPRYRRLVAVAGNKTDKPDQVRSRVAWSTRNLIKEKKIRPKKSLGQNFLQSPEVLQAITQAAELQPGDSVLEIGPGTGNLTTVLLETGAFVTAVEKDDALYASLLEEFAQEVAAGRLRLILSDILAMPEDAFLEALAPRQQAEQVRPPKIVANLPYNMTKSILQRLLPMGDHVSHLYLMIQDEVAQRLLANPGDQQEYRAMNVEVAFYSRATYLFRVDKTAYVPQPGVDGAVVRFQLRPRSRYPVQEDLLFVNMVKLAFSERRKMVRNTLLSKWSSEEVTTALETAGLSTTTRPQQLTADDYVRLWQNLPTVVDIGAVPETDAFEA